MRIKFGSWIQSCSFVSNPGGRMMNASTDNGLYTIIFESEENAEEAYKKILEQGYYDATDCEYSNVRHQYFR